MTTFELLYFGYGFGKVRLKRLAECLPRETFGIGNSLTEGDIGLLMLMPPIDFVNAKGTTPSTVTSVAEVSSILELLCPVLFPMGWTRWTITDRRVKRAVDN
ncbi:hypothetical protein G6F63_015810 [Rhizopus arrhizus]|nr:hypothetical protein G6F35_017996 [Rhizopus arrhizus]KAG1243206.1 hypothetical protein G6F65_022557 [Rhizopus arrhizus]KAG1317093.1 hypothetical protein G6F63_015810 [Rhizopus arrhizus]KAG1385084.1 hypothetical protein G6F59_017618 [Rhizopus arrhizus]KAG1385601.1 hypothetical protein G6F60_014781 [Rhizopus arrhizus]